MSGASGLEPILTDPDVSEIMIPGPNNVWVERTGKLQPNRAPALDERAPAHAAIHISRPLGLDPAQNPIVDARLDDGSRVAICVPPGQSQRGYYRAALRQAELLCGRPGAPRVASPRDTDR